MVKTRLLKLMGRDSLDVLQEIIWQWIGLLAQLVLVGCIAIMISDAYYDILSVGRIIRYLIIAAFSIGARQIFIKLQYDSKIYASEAASEKIRREIYGKLLKLGNSYTSVITRKRLAKMVTEDATLVEEYYSDFLPRIGYACIGTLTMSVLLLIINPLAMSVMLVAIAGIIAALFVAKKYENVISIKYIIAAMDALAFLGAAFGLRFSMSELALGDIRIEIGIITMFLCFEIFRPLRELGEAFSDGIISAKSIDDVLKFIDAREPKQGKAEVGEEPIRVVFDGVYYSYKGQEVLKSAAMLVAPGKITGLTGAKGAGKSTLANILTKRNRAYKGSVKINGKELSAVNDMLLMKDLTYITDESYVFKTTVRSNLQLGNPKVTDKRMIGALSVVNLWSEFKGSGGLDMVIDDEKTLTRGQKQRLLLARALLKNSKLYIFDNVTDMVDEKSKAIIMKLVFQLAKDMGRTVLLISDDYEDLKGADTVYALSEGVIDKYGKGIKTN